MLITKYIMKQVIWDTVLKAEESKRMTVVFAQHLVRAYNIAARYSIFASLVSLLKKPLIKPDRPNSHMLLLQIPHS